MKEKIEEMKKFRTKQYSVLQAKWCCSKGEPGVVMVVRNWTGREEEEPGGRNTALETFPTSVACVAATNSHTREVPVRVGTRSGNDSLGSLKEFNR